MRPDHSPLPALQFLVHQLPVRPLPDIFDDWNGLQRLDTQPLVYHNDNYAAGQHLARTLREAASNGIVYDSVRRTEGECAAAFRPPLLSNSRQERRLCYVWSGQQIVTVYAKPVNDNGAATSVEHWLMLRPAIRW